MKKCILSISFAVLLTMAFQPAAQGATAESVAGNKYFCVGVLVGFVPGYVPGVRPIVDSFTFSQSIFSAGLLTLEGFNDSFGAYTIDDEDFGFERISATCLATDPDKDLVLSYEIKGVNIIDLGIVGNIQLEGRKGGEDAGSAIGVFFGLRNLFD